MNQRQFDSLPLNHQTNVLARQSISAIGWHAANNISLASNPETRVSILKCNKVPKRSITFFPAQRAQLRHWWVLSPRWLVVILSLPRQHPGGMPMLEYIPPFSRFNSPMRNNRCHLGTAFYPKRLAVPHTPLHFFFALGGPSGKSNLEQLKITLYQSRGGKLTLAELMPCSITWTRQQCCRDRDQTIFQDHD